MHLPRLLALSLPDDRRFRLPDLREFAGSVLLAAVLFTLTLVASGLGDGLSPQSQGGLLYGTGPVGLLIACIVGPVCEEVLFREALPRLLAGAMRVQFALVLSAAAFAAVHLGLGWPAWAALFLGGLMLSAAYNLSGNLLVPIVAHALLNASLIVYQALG